MNPAGQHGETGSGNVVAGDCLDADTAEVLLLEERPRLLRYVAAHMPSRLAPMIAADDVLQDVYVEAFRRIGQFRRHDETSVYRWLVTIARNHLSALLRRHRSQKRGGRSTSVPHAGDSLVLFLHHVADGRHKSPGGAAASVELISAVERAVGRLDGAMGPAVRLRYLEGLTPAEVAETMGKTVAAVQKLCWRGLQTLRDDLRSASLYI
jgi:RNA polymerase sigma-70 factor (ECF subfamily)